MSRALAVAVLFTAACTGTSTTPPPVPSQALTVYGDYVSGATFVQGYAWDPEAFFFSLATVCPPPPAPCAFPPLTLPEDPNLGLHFERSAIQGATVYLFDPAQGKPAFAASTPSKASGGWQVKNVTSRPGPPFFPLWADPSGQEKPTLKAFGPTTLPPIPAGDYGPTFVLRPIFTQFTDCIGMAAPLVSKVGVLDAVAKYLTATGTPTSVADLYSPAKFGGVVVTWLYASGPSALRAPAKGSTLGAAVTSPASVTARVLHIDWAPPGVGPPTQSPRGFFVNDAVTASPQGLTVTLLTPAAQPPTLVAFTPGDPVTDAANDRPWQFPPLPPMPIAPGTLSFNELQAVPRGSPPPPQFVCIQ
ncbi:MAG: hypothetical protein ACT4TC_20535 [Myxococcaceae bacterium]